MKAVESVVVTVDGQSKCGKTAVIEAIAARSVGRANRITPEALVDERLGLSEYHRLRVLAFQSRHSFSTITQISAGNMFRAAVLYKRTQEERGRTISAFTADDVDALKALLAEDGVADMLQNDPDIGTRVSTVAQMAGVQALCGAIFCDAVTKAYTAGGGGNLVIVDARDPIGHLQRNNLLGVQDGQVHPASIVPVYVETSTDTAARRLTRQVGTYDNHWANVAWRRFSDATRDELPVVAPTNLVHDFGAWQAQFHAGVSRSEVAAPYCFNNEIDDLQRISGFAGYIAAIAHDVGIRSHYQLAA